MKVKEETKSQKIKHQIEKEGQEPTGTEGQDSPKYKYEKQGRNARRFFASLRRVYRMLGESLHAAWG